jgi:hypothetical protein
MEVGDGGVMDRRSFLALVGSAGASLLVWGAGSPNGQRAKPPKPTTTTTPPMLGHYGGYRFGYV